MTSDEILLDFISKITLLTIDLKIHHLSSCLLKLWVYCIFSILSASLMPSKPIADIDPFVDRSSGSFSAMCSLACSPFCSNFSSVIQPLNSSIVGHWWSVNHTFVWTMSCLCFTHLLISFGDNLPAFILFYQPVRITLLSLKRFSGAI